MPESLRCLLVSSARVSLLLAFKHLCRVLMDLMVLMQQEHR